MLGLGMIKCIKITKVAKNITKVDIENTNILHEETYIDRFNRTRSTRGSSKKFGWMLQLIISFFLFCFLFLDNKTYIPQQDCRAYYAIKNHIKNLKQAKNYGIQTDEKVELNSTKNPEFKRDTYEENITLNYLNYFKEVLKELESINDVYIKWQKTQIAIERIEENTYLSDNEKNTLLEKFRQIVNSLHHII
jgi:hypothetical protein